MVFADEAHRLLDGCIIRQLELDRGDVVRSAGGMSKSTPTKITVRPVWARTSRISLSQR
jgi:hypothetical protein